MSRRAPIEGALPRPENLLQTQTMGLFISKLSMFCSFISGDSAKLLEFATNNNKIRVSRNKICVGFIPCFLFFTQNNGAEFLLKSHSDMRFCNFAQTARLDCHEIFLKVEQIPKNILL